MAEYPLHLSAIGDDYDVITRNIFARLNDEYKAICHSKHDGPLKVGIYRSMQFDQLPKLRSSSTASSTSGKPYEIIEYHSYGDGELEPLDFNEPSHETARTVTVYDYVVSNANDDNQQFARHLFHALRYFDETVRVDYILTHGVSETGIGAALMNRLRKAATKIISVVP